MFTLTPIVRRLLILWVALWVLDFLGSLMGAGFSQWLLLDPWGLFQGDWSAAPGLVGYVFIHDSRSLFHLLGNAWMFALFAPEIERLFPGRRFLLLLLRATLVGSFATLFLAWMLPQSFSNPVLGGSGLVAAVLAASAAMYPHRILNLILLRVRLLHLFLFLTVLDLLGFLAQCAGQGKPVAYAVHLAGALVGWLAVGGFQRFPGPWQKFALARRARKDAKRKRYESECDAFLDHLLAKISRDGMHSLSAEEKRFLLDRSRKGGS